MPLALLVDDKDECLYLLRALLTGHGYQVQLAHHGAEALARAQDHVPDLVISDVLMPVMDGFTLCRRWHEEATLRAVPFVFYTATYTEPKDEQLALSLGAARFLIKPKEPEEFLVLIEEVLEEYRAQRLRAPAAAAPSEEQYLRQHNAALARKLEDKLVQLHDKDALNRGILDAMAAPIAAIGPRGEILATNRAWVHLTASPCVPGALRLGVGEDALAALATGPGREEDLRRLEQGLREVLEDRRASSEIELSFGGCDASRTYVVRIERTRSASAGAVVACIDVSELKRAEQAIRESSARKDQFLAVLGHELRNPLGAIRTATEVLHRVGLPEDRAERAVKAIDRQTTNLVRIINDLLDVSRIGRGHISVGREPTDWAEVVSSSVEDARAGFEARGVSLRLEEPATPAWVAGDATRLAQVIDNLLGNAQKFTPRGGRVEVRLEAEGPGGWGTLRVADDGAGMSAETLARVFQPFEQAPQGAARTSGGLGLGLALVRGLVDLHGGETHAESPGPGRGSTFVVRLPLIEPPVVRDRPAEAPRVPGSRVLIIEDNRDAADVLRTLLEVAGSTVAVAHDGPSGLALARRVLPETVVCDIGLPGPLDGFGVARALRGEPALRSVQLVAVTGYGQAEDVRRAKESGFDLHLTKPVRAPDLLAVVARSHEQAQGANP